MDYVISIVSIGKLLIFQNGIWNKINHGTQRQTQTQTQ